jgi:hypothetical protein
MRRRSRKDLPSKTEMRVLLLSTLVYLTGVAAVLFLRPALMFRPDGSWKEFGLEGHDVSPFPFWLFCMSWAIVSFFLSRAVVGAGAVATAATVAALATHAEEDRLAPLAPPAAAPKKKAKPGYYKLNAAATKKDGVPRYIYLGAELPGADSSEEE